MSCLFNSLSRFINKDSNTIRQEICNYLQNNGKLMDGIETSQILAFENQGNNYIQNMRLPSTWGGAIEIQAACNIWNMNVIVNDIRVTPSKQIHFEPITKIDTSNTIQVTWSGGHYEPVC